MDNKNQTFDLVTHELVLCQMNLDSERLNISKWKTIVCLSQNKMKKKKCFYIRVWNVYTSVARIC